MWHHFQLSKLSAQLNLLVIRLHSNSYGGYVVDLTPRPGRHSSCIVLSHHLNLQNLALIFFYILMIILLIKYCLKMIIYIKLIGIQLQAYTRRSVYILETNCIHNLITANQTIMLLQSQHRGSLGLRREGKELNVAIR